MAPNSSREARGRLAVAAALLPVLYWTVRFGPRGLFLALVGAVILIGQVEFYRMAFGKRLRPASASAMAAGAAIVVLLIRWDAVNIRLFLTSAVIGFLIYHLVSRADCFQRWGVGGTLILGILYLGWLPAHLILLREMPGGPQLVIFLLTMTWGVDAGAYYVGRAIGSHRLAPVVSPKKTVEGAVGGFLVGVLIAWAASRWYLTDVATKDFWYLGVGLGIFGQVGDLVESRIKRAAGVKDSSGLIPSHGGLLDKVDSLLFNAPYLYYYMVLVKGTAIPVLRI